MFSWLLTEIDPPNGFKAGAVDYITKPFYPIELMARVENHLAIKRAREEIKTLKGIIPICANCKSIRDDKGYWKQVDEYIAKKHGRAVYPWYL